MRLLRLGLLLRAVARANGGGGPLGGNEQHLHDLQGPAHGRLRGFGVVLVGVHRQLAMCSRSHYNDLPRYDCV